MDFYEEILTKWAECNTSCDLKVNKTKTKEGLEKADRYMKTLPGADYVLTQTLNYIFSNGLTTGSINEDEVLNEFLYKVNRKGNTNVSELKNIIGHAITHGASGMRWYAGCIYQYKWGTYKILTYKDDGIEQIFGYIVSKDAGKVPDFKYNPDNYKTYDDFLREIDEQDLIFLSENEFCVIRNDTSEWYGSSPLLADEARLDLIVAVYDRLNYDIRYDGPGRIIIRPKDGYVKGDGEISTTEIMSEALKSEEQRIAAIKKETERVASALKGSSSDSVIVLSNAFDDNIEHLERVTKATEFLNWLKDDTVILAQDFGMAPSLLELGGISGNVSMTSILDSAMLNSIVPLRERYAIQFSKFVSDHLGVEKIFFNIYEMQQQENENTMRTKVVNIMSLLNAMHDENGQIRDGALKLFNDFADMLSENIHNENNKLEEL